MTKNRFKWSAIATVLVAASLASGLASAADEQQESYIPTNTCNNLPSQAQPLVFDSSGVAVMNGTIMNGFGLTLNGYCNIESHSGGDYHDIDFYSFHANAGQVFNIGITNGWNGTYTWTVLGVFGPPDSAGTYTLLTSGAQYGNAFIKDGFHANADGTYYVGVTSDPSRFEDNGVLTSYLVWQDSPFAGIAGNYTLTVEPAAPPVIPVSIQIQPGNKDVTILNATGVAHPESVRGIARGHIPVAVLSSKDFDATTVNQSKLRFGSTGKEDSLVKCNPHGVDVNHDGYPDLLCHFDMQKANFPLSQNEGYLTGETADGQAFAGHAWLRIVTVGLTPPNAGGGHK